MTKLSKLKDELVDREAIRECLYRYCRGIDRRNADIVRSAYWPEAIDNHITFEGNVEEFIAWGFPNMTKMTNHQHHVTNILIELDGDTAKVESYFWSCVVHHGETSRDRVGGGRYLDTFERRNDEWRIASRYVVSDWFRAFDDGCDYEKAGGTPLDSVGRGNDTDKSFTLLGIKV